MRGCEAIYGGLQSILKFIQSQRFFAILSAYCEDINRGKENV